MNRRQNCYGSVHEKMTNDCCFPIVGFTNKSKFCIRGFFGAFMSSDNVVKAFCAAAYPIQRYDDAKTRSFLYPIAA